MLKYLFTVEYKDGSIYEQNTEDISISDKTKSCYFDINQDEVKVFSLKGNGHTYLVNLEDGHFEIDEVPFKFHEENLKDLRLVFWRRHTYSLNIDLQEKAHEIVYRFGWQANDDKGQNIQRVMEIN